MFEFEVLTIRDLNFDDDRGKKVTGQQLWLLSESADESWNGFEVSKVWIPDGHPMESVVAQLAHNDRVSIQFDRRGKPVKINVL